jgi:chaperone modulatory protein CbpM
MQTENLIAIHEFCINHNIEISFISSLQQYGLIETTSIEGNDFIDAGQLQQLEKIIRLHYELDINIEGIESITHLLQRIESLQHEIITLRNRLHLYETYE